ncbi:MAG: TetR/AcrR family transcriptional regulator [Lachnospiraceae bacterium]
MDRRQQKTRRAIFDAFDRLLAKKRYEQITIADILEEADIGRSTFYAHFASKDALLETMCGDIVSHVFSQDLTREQGHDYSHGDHSLEERIEHFCRHLYENKEEIIRILTYESSDIFVRYLTGDLERMFAKLPSGDTKVPEDLRIVLQTESFISAIRWWAREKMKTSPETFARYYLAMMPGGPAAR